MQPLCCQRILKRFPIQSVSGRLEPQRLFSGGQNLYPCARRLTAGSPVTLLPSEVCIQGGLLMVVI
jgi:hypothetical protein